MAKRKRPCIIISFVATTTIVLVNLIRLESNSPGLTASSPALSKLASHPTSSTSSTSASSDENKKSHHHSKSRCERLQSHSSGHWHHEYYPRINNDTINPEDANEYYFSQEMDWLHGKNIPSKIDKNTCKQFENSKSTMMYVNQVGNQCGCNMPGFKPSMSKWIHGATSHNGASHHGMHSSLRLAHNLAKTNSHLCFVGDSIDYQMYDALKFNLHRVLKLEQQGHHAPYDYPIIFIEENNMEVNVSRTDNGKFYIPDGWRLLTEILETKVIFYGDNRTAKFSYFKHYGWSPWDIELLEECNIIILNLSLHYNFWGEAGRKNSITNVGNRLLDDVKAAITTLVNFTSSKSNRVAVWRSALPQHFNTFHGHYVESAINENHTCVPLENYKMQIYNLFHNDAFNAMCHHDNNLQNCSSFEEICTANIKETAYQTVYQFRKSHNLTTWVNEKEDPVKIGRILRWNIADLFDNYLWHSDKTDCTHFCYIPQLYDAAFERLDLLLGST